MKVLIETDSDRILGFTMFGVGAGDVMAAVQMAMLGGLPYTAIRDAVIAHPTMPEGLILLFNNVPPPSPLPNVRGSAEFLIGSRLTSARTTSSWTSTETTKSYKETDREKGNYPRRTV
jgi:hypothetical protein